MTNTTDPLVPDKQAEQQEQRLRDLVIEEIEKHKTPVFMPGFFRRVRRQDRSLIVLMFIMIVALLAIIFAWTALERCAFGWCETTSSAGATAASTSPTENGNIVSVVVPPASDSTSVTSLEQSRDHADAATKGKTAGLTAASTSPTEHGNIGSVVVLPASDSTSVTSLEQSRDHADAATKGKTAGLTAAASTSSIEHGNVGSVAVPPAAQTSKLGLPVSILLALAVSLLGVLFGIMGMKRLHLYDEEFGRIRKELNERVALFRHENEAMIQQAVHTVLEKMQKQHKEQTETAAKEAIDASEQAVEKVKASQSQLEELIKPFEFLKGWGGNQPSSC